MPVLVTGARQAPGYFWSVLKHCKYVVRSFRFYTGIQLKTNVNYAVNWTYNSIRDVSLSNVRGKNSMDST